MGLGYLVFVLARGMGGAGVPCPGPWGGRGMRQVETGGAR